MKALLVSCALVAMTSNAYAVCITPECIMIDGFGNIERALISNLSELSTKLDDQERQIDSLESKIDELVRKIDALEQSK